MSTSILNKFNRGEIEPLAYGRDDVEPLRHSAETMENFLPITLGPMHHRQGLEFQAAVADSGARFFPFVWSASETALLEFADSELRIWQSGTTLITRTSVTTTFTNGDFSSFTGWTKSSGGSTTATASGGKLVLTGTKTEDAVAYQTLTTETGEEHALRIVVERAEVRLKIGTSGASSTDISDELLAPGTYSIVFTPASNITVTLVNDQAYPAHVDEVSFDGDVTFTLPTDVPIASVNDLQLKASGGNIYCTWTDKPFVVRRLGTKSWGVCEYRFVDGPFDFINLDEGLTLTPGALTGETTLTASKAHFKDPESVGTLRRLVSSGQEVSASVTAEDNGTNSIRVTGIEDGRKFTYQISGTFVASVTLQRSTDDSTWVDADGPWTGARSATFDDGADNAIYYYRLHVKTGDFTSGTVALSLSYPGGGIEGTCRVISVSSATVATVQVLEDFGKTDATRNWYQTQWGDGKGYPNAVGIYEGRLVLAGKDGVWASVSDIFESFDREIEGASASIYRRIGFGPVDEVSWIDVATRIAIATPSDIIPLRSSSFGEIITADNANLRQGPEKGAASILPSRLRDALYFTEQSEQRIYRLGYQGQTDGFAMDDLMTYNRSICSPGIVEHAISSEPDQRLWAVLSDGEARVLLFDAIEGVNGWARFTVKDSTIKRVVTLPSSGGETRVFMVVAYDGTEYLCRLAKFSEVNTRPVDLYTNYAGPIQTCTGLSHFEGDSVDAWAGSVKVGSFTVSSGQIDLGDTYSDVTVGLTVTGTYTSARLRYYDDRPRVTERKRVEKLSILLKDLWFDGFTYGRASGKLKSLRKVVNGWELDTTALIDEIDTTPDEFEGSYDSDSRIVLQATGPATVIAMEYMLVNNASNGEKR